MKKLLSALLIKCYGLYLNSLVLITKNKAATTAFYIFCTVRKGKVLAHQKEFLDGAKDKIHTIQGNKIQSYKWQGAKQTVLLVHGWESNVFRWRNLIKKLKLEGYTIVAFDAPAHGYSSGKYLHVPVYEKTLKSLITEYNPKFIIGHSVGGMTVMYNQYLNSNPSIEKIISISAPSEFYEIMMHFKNLLGLSNKVMLAIETYINDKFGFSFKEFSTSNFAKNNTKKGLLFHDTLDKITPYHNSVAVQKAWKNSQLITTTGLGHSMHQEDVNKAIIDFLNS